MKLLDDNQLLRIEAHLARLLDGLAVESGIGPLGAVLKQFVLAGGKRIRPQLCLWAYENGLGGPPSAGVDETALLDLSCAWEIFHAFLLVHDDIIDGADVRREQASLHRQLQALDHNCPRFGQNLAIVSGDLLFSAALRVFHDVDLPAELYRRQLRLFSRVACVTGYGQAVDITQSAVALDDVCEETLLRGYNWKTAAYTFEGPMVCGGICANLPETALECVSRFATAIGKAYQLQNDLIDLSAPAREGCDLLEAKRTLTLVRARRAMLESDRREFDGLMAQLPTANGHAVGIAEALRLRLLETDAPAQTRAMIDRLLTEARVAARSAELPSSLARATETLLDTLERSYFALPAAAVARATSP